MGIIKKQRHISKSGKAILPFRQITSVNRPKNDLSSSVPARSNGFEKVLNIKKQI
jgi:hypothetical protein